MVDLTNGLLGGHSVERRGAPLHQERQGQVHPGVRAGAARAHSRGKDRALLLGEVRGGAVQDAAHITGQNRIIT